MLTRDEIMSMQAGRELDALITERVFDGKWPYWYDETKNGGMIMPFYSTSIADAWQVVEKLRTTDPFNAGARFAETIAEMTDADQDDYMADAFNLIFNLSPLVISKAALMTTIR